MFKFCALLSSIVVITGCTMRQAQLAPAHQVVDRRHPIAMRVHGKYVDEDSPLKYTVHFKNHGREVLSFDYTLAKERGVPHIDREGPNSGLVNNLYPGAEIEVPNPFEKRAVKVTFGKVTYGKKAPAELDALYRPPTSLVAQESASVLPAEDALPR